MEQQEIPESIKLYTLQETAKILKVTERTIHRFIKDGRLRAKKIGRWRISQEAIEDFLKNNNDDN